MGRGTGRAPDWGKASGSGRGAGRAGGTGKRGRGGRARGSPGPNRGAARRPMAAPPGLPSVAPAPEIKPVMSSDSLSLPCSVLQLPHEFHDALVVSITLIRIVRTRACHPFHEGLLAVEAGKHHPVAHEILDGLALGQAERFSVPPITGEVADAAGQPMTVVPVRILRANLKQELLDEFVAAHRFELGQLLGG